MQYNIYQVHTDIYTFVNCNRWYWSRRGTSWDTNNGQTDVVIVLHSRLWLISIYSTYCGSSNVQRTCTGIRGAQAVAELDASTTHAEMCLWIVWDWKTIRAKNLQQTTCRAMRRVSMGKKHLINAIVHKLLEWDVDWEAGHYSGWAGSEWHVAPRCVLKR